MTVRKPRALTYNPNICPPFGGEPVKAIKRLRRCRWKGCTTILSRYNQNNYCGVHWVKILDEKIK